MFALPLSANAVGIITDANGNVVGTLACPEATTRQYIVARLNLFDDLLRNVEVLHHYKYPDLPILADEDAKLTIKAAKPWSKTP